MPVSNIQKPILSTLINSGFTFSKCHYIKNVPYDPDIYKLFDGEDIYHYVRLWTRGYDVYTPNKVVVVHDYDNKLLEKNNLPVIQLYLNFNKNCV